MIKRHFKKGHDMASDGYCHQKAAVQWSLLQQRKRHTIEVIVK